MRDCNFIMSSFPLRSMFWIVATFGESPPFYVAVCNSTGLDMSAGESKHPAPLNVRLLSQSQRHDCKHSDSDWLAEYDFRSAEFGGRVFCDGVEEVWCTGTLHSPCNIQPNHEDPETASATTTSCDKVQRKYVSYLRKLRARRRSSGSC